MWFYMSDLLFIVRFWTSTRVVYLHGWCHMKLLPSRRKFCVHRTPCHFMQSCLFACGADCISQLSVMLRKAVQTSDSGCCFCCGDSSDSEPVPFTTSEPIDSRPSIQEGIQTSQESVNTNERPRSNQALVNVDWYGGSQARGCWKWCCYLSDMRRIPQ